MTLIHFVRNIYYVLIALKVNGLDNTLLKFSL